MQTQGQTVLITGGTGGIGKALAERFLAAGNRVIVTGRHERRLAALRAEHPFTDTSVPAELIASELATNLQRAAPAMAERIMRYGL